MQEDKRTYKILFLSNEEMKSFQFISDGELIFIDKNKEEYQRCIRFLNIHFPNKFADNAVSYGLNIKGSFSDLSMETFIEHVAIVNNFAVTHSQSMTGSKFRTLKIYFYRPDK